MKLLLTAVFRACGLLAAWSVIALVWDMPSLSGWAAAFTAVSILVGICVALFGLFVEVEP